jgi:DNA-binding transcriptional MerR regulator
MELQGLHIGQLAKRSGASADTIRYYQRIGLMPTPARTPAGYRVYSESAIGRVRLVQNALRFGFSRKQLGAFLGVRRAGGAPCQNVRAAGAQIPEAIEHQIAELTASRESIKETLVLWDRRLSQTSEGQPAHLLEALPADEMQSQVRRRPLVGRRSRLQGQRPAPHRQERLLHIKTTEPGRLRRIQGRPKYVRIT